MTARRNRPRVVFTETVPEVLADSPHRTAVPSARVETITAAVADVLDGHRQPHELPPDLHDLWRDGWRCGQDAASARVARAEAEADRWYYRANNAPEIRAGHERALRAFDVALARKSTAERWAELDRIAAERSEAGA